MGAVSFPGHRETVALHDGQRGGRREVVMEGDGRGGCILHQHHALPQRVLHLVHDANQATFCNKDGAFVNIKIVIDIKVAGPAKPCALFQLDDLALYYLLSMADDSVKARDPYTNFINSLL